MRLKVRFSFQSRMKVKYRRITVIHMAVGLLSIVPNFKQSHLIKRRLIGTHAPR